MPTLREIAARFGFAAHRAGAGCLMMIPATSMAANLPNCVLRGSA